MHNNAQFAVCVLHESLLSGLAKPLIADIRACASCLLVVTDVYKSCSEIARGLGILPAATIRSSSNLDEVFKCIQVRG
jgi:hypothetical protein